MSHEVLHWSLCKKFNTVGQFYSQLRKKNVGKGISWMLPTLPNATNLEVCIVPEALEKGSQIWNQINGFTWNVGIKEGKHQKDTDL